MNGFSRSKDSRTVGIQAILEKTRVWIAIVMSLIILMPLSTSLIFAEPLYDVIELSTIDGNDRITSYSDTILIKKQW